MIKILLFISAFVFALSVVLKAGTIHSTIDCGGGRSSAMDYVNDTSLGAIGEIVVFSGSTNRGGYVGQLTETASLVITGTPARVDETESTQLSGTVIMSDDTITALTGNEIRWGAASWPVTSINSNGFATTAIVYRDTQSTLNGTYLDMDSSSTLLVFDTIPDNYGSYADDGLPDSWQYNYFGLNNPNAAPSADPTSCGQNNQFKYVAGLDPTNATSLFQMRIELAQGQPTQAKLVFKPRWYDRTYTPIFCTTLVGGSAWTNLLTTTVNDNGNERTLTDTNGVDNARFYRIQITYP